MASEEEINLKLALTLTTNTSPNSGVSSSGHRRDPTSSQQHLWGLAAALGRMLLLPPPGGDTEALGTACWVGRRPESDGSFGLCTSLSLSYFRLPLLSSPLLEKTETRGTLVQHRTTDPVPIPSSSLTSLQHAAPQTPLFFQVSSPSPPLPAGKFLLFLLP